MPVRKDQTQTQLYLQGGGCVERCEQLVTDCTQPVMQPGMSRAAYHVVAVDALDIGGHLIDPVPDKLAWRQASVDLVQVCRVGLVLQGAGLVSHVLPGKSQAAACWYLTQTAKRLKLPQNSPAGLNVP